MMKKLCLSVVFVFLLGMTNSNAQGCSGQFKTFTIGGWGTVCKGNNPGCYRDANFDAAFPDGITIGCGQNTLTFTSSQAVEEFLPSGGTPALLSGALVDPAGTINNTLASQVLAVSLAVGFDVYDADFASSTSGFGSLPILSGAHAGMTVANFLTYANQVIGGCAEGDLSALNATATAINENYDNGTVDQSYLECNSNRAYNIQITSSVNCYGYLNGAVTVTVTGGSAPYHFELFKDGTSVASSGEVLSNSYLFTGLGAGSYTASVTDAAGIVSSGPAVFQVVEPVAIAASVSSTAVSCFGGSNGTATIDSATISGGVGPYTFAWANASTDSTIIGLSAGSYTVTVTDSLGCSVDFSVKVGQPTVLSYSSSITNVTCFGANNGSATITPAGGTAPYTILWDNQSTSFTRGSLAPSVNYTAVVTDANECTTNVSVSVTQPSTALGSSNSTSSVSCFGGNNGSVSVTASGGTSPYTILWSTGETTFNRSNLSAETYTAVITDANGCTSNVSETITQPAVLGSTDNTTNVTCFGANNGSTTITPTGGTAPYTILWDNQSTSFTRGSLAPSVNYTAVVTDANECTTNVSVSVTQPSTALGSSNSTSSVSCFGGNNGNISVTASGGTSPYNILWSTGETTFNRSNLSAGTYTAVITDANGCTSNVSETISQPAVLGSTDNTINVTCFGANNGSTTITPTGGTAPYTILWDNQSTSFTRGSLAPSVNYTAVVTDANECTTNVSVSVTQPPVLSVAAVRTQVLCYGGTGTGTATPAGGTAPYSYSWNTNPLQTSAVANLPVGTWTVRVTDANGCTVSSSVTLSLLSCEGFTTVTPGGYGAPCSGGNWGCYLATNFATKFPTGLQVGSGTRFLKFTSAAAVKGFLPSGTTARTLNAGTLTNPTAKSYSNVLAGHTVALTLSIGFDTNPAFSPSTTSLGSLVVSSGVFAGKSVNELLTIANTILGGGASPYTASQINAALDAVNRNYDNGTVNLGYLACPCTASKMATNDGIIAQVKAEVTVYPNPVKGNSTLEFTLNYDSKVKVVIYNINGQIVNDVYEGKVSGEVKNAININSTGMKSGVYIVKLTTDRESVTKSLLIAE